MHPPDHPTENPLLTLQYESAFEQLGTDFSDPVPAAEFPQHLLRFRNDDVLQILGLDPHQVSDEHFRQAFGRFEHRSPLLAMRYHGYQFGSYNPALGDGRGFLYGQVRGGDGELYDFGTKGSGTTPYSRGGDGRLTLKGGVREVLAAEMLHRLGVRTSRCLSLIETGESLWRGDEPSPTRSSVMVRLNRSHIRFGTFERLAYFGRKDLIAILLEHVIEVYYPHLLTHPDRYALVYAELVQRVAELAAQWMAAGFCHAVLNTDNMSMTGESFDYGPYAFIPSYLPDFTAAYFDYYGRYAYANQPDICRWNLEMLQAPLQLLVSSADLDAGLNQFPVHYQQAYQTQMLDRLGFGQLEPAIGADLVADTVQFLQESQVEYQPFFWQLTQQFSPQWRDRSEDILTAWLPEMATPEVRDRFHHWQQQYHRALNSLPSTEMPQIQACLKQYNAPVNLTRPQIEAIWQPIVEDDDWQPFIDLLAQIRR